MSARQQFPMLESFAVGNGTGSTNTVNHDARQALDFMDSQADELDAERRKVVGLEAQLVDFQTVRWGLIRARERLAAELQGDVDDLRAANDRLTEALRELHDWALDACCQGTGTIFGTPEWNHCCTSTWEDADDLLPRIAALLAGAVQETEQPSIMERCVAWHTAKFPDKTPAELLNKATEELGELARAFTGEQEHRPNRGDVCQEAGQTILTVVTFLGRYKGKDATVEANAELDRLEAAFISEQVERAVQEAER